MTIINAASFFCDILFALIYFRKKRQVSIQRQGLALILLFLTVILYFVGAVPFFSNSWTRFICRALLYTGHLLCLKPHAPLEACYGACFWTTICTFCHNGFLAPATYPIFAGTARFGSSVAVDQLVCALILIGAKSACYGTVCMLVPINRAGDIGKFRLGILLITAWISIAVKNSQIPLMDGGSGSVRELSLYMISLQFVLLVLLVLLELYQRQMQEHMAIQYQNLSANALLKQIQAKQENDQSIRMLRHDLKNHFLTLRHFLQEGRSDAALAYVDEFLQQATPAGLPIRTGCPLMDGLLLEKLGEARDHGIAVRVNLDFRKGGFLRDFDLCTIVGNLLDNALEACNELPLSQERYIEIRGGCMANCLLFHAANSCLRQADTVSGLPFSTKTDRLSHGYGLLNVQRALKKYNGNLTLTSDEPGRFEAAVLIPIPEGTEPSPSL